MNRDQFLPNDARAAITEYRASWTNITRAEESLINGDLKEAKLAAANLLSSLNELEKLHKKKEEVDLQISKLNFLLGRNSLRGLVVRIHEN
ncbi:hypothetical protein J7E38_13495 [Bacillus sp. ISL-35]|uniref:hypothetical protein n=1 Tax=Bacillus sp. ISL-35 TaxID=2819122 RepID=UPI001BEAC134|nr:hypothetical protein [Bacillus sp. ISL-35]MBT2680023.1 hypothetical protein [Bacillus sp. ISL-35]MBT2703001.1 hypothetical protein [Chryseobacterium sp. ISL-80]